MIRVKNIKVKVQGFDEFFSELESDLKEMKGGGYKKKEDVAFESLSVLQQYLTPKRIELLKLIKKQEPESLYELAQVSKRPLKSIHRDINVLKRAGLIEVVKTKDGRRRSMPIVNYDKISIGIEI
jgi:predicted transcriptional regulator